MCEYPLSGKLFMALMAKHNSNEAGGGSRCDHSNEVETAEVNGNNEAETAGLNDNNKAETAGMAT
jgi:hypothetical protein